MAEVPAHYLPPRNVALRTGATLPARGFHQQAVRIGNFEPASITLVRQSALPLVTVLMLLVCALAGGQPLSVPFWAFALVTYAISAQVLSPLDLKSGAQAAARARQTLARMALEWSCIAAALVFIRVAFRLHDVVPRDVLFGWVFATPMALLIADSISVPIAKALARDHSIAHRYIIIGANDVGLELARRIAESHSGGQFVGFYDFRSAARLSETFHRSVTPNCSARDFADAVRREGITQVYIALPLSTAPRIGALLNELRDTTATVYFVPNLFAFDLVQARCVEINGMPVFSICDSPLDGMNGFWKRVFDVAFASSLLLLFWPVLLAIGAAIKLTSPGPALFKQRRYGLNGEEILVYKFRTMNVCEDGPVVDQAKKHDQRVTPIGALLRRTSIDELPQILNVLEGKMSFVGPRPHAVAHNEAYRKLIDGYMIRHKVRPGITGWAQVNGLRGETSTVDKMERRVQYDIDYLKTWSLGFDLRIILLTIVRVFQDAQAY
jgi:putative colanic acid biosysnthesis UDP-glucose lipid carrier transferase